MHLVMMFHTDKSDSYIGHCDIYCRRALQTQTFRIPALGTKNCLGLNCSGIFVVVVISVGSETLQSVLCQFLFFR